MERRDEGIRFRVTGQYPDRTLHDPGLEPAGVDHTVPGPPLRQRLQGRFALPIALDRLRARRRRARLPAVEQRHLVTTSQRLVNERTAQEDGSTDKKDLHDRKAFTMQRTCLARV